MPLYRGLWVLWKGCESMLLNELKVRLKTEFEAYRLYLTNADLSAEELFNKAYEIASKSPIKWTCCVIGCNCYRRKS